MKCAAINATVRPPAYCTNGYFSSKFMVPLEKISISGKNVMGCRRTVSSYDAKRLVRLLQSLSSNLTIERGIVCMSLLVNLNCLARVSRGKAETHC